MHIFGGSSRTTRAVGLGFVSATVLAGLLAMPSASADEGDPVEEPTVVETTETPVPEETSTPEVSSAESSASASASASAPPYGNAYPVRVETNFTQPKRSISSYANSDFSQLRELKRIIQGTYLKPNGKTKRVGNGSRWIYISVSRMENAYLSNVRGALADAADAGVNVRFIHGEASQSVESRWIQAKLNADKTGKFKICAKGRSLACLSGLRGAIMHSKILLVGTTKSARSAFATYSADGAEVKNAVWTGSINLGGPSGERTYNNGMTIYNDKKLWKQMRELWDDMWAERNVGNDYLQYVKNHKTKYGYSGAGDDGYDLPFAKYGMFYSNLANVTIYPTPIKANPLSGTDPVLEMLNRVIPDNRCRIRVQENRFKYRRIAVAYKLVELANQGCKVSAITFRDDLEINRIKHCQQWMRICKPILDVFKTSTRHIDAAWAKPHDKTILVDALMGPNKLNKEEVPAGTPAGTPWPSKDNGGVRTLMVQAGSAALTGSNLIVSDEIMIESTDPLVYADYLDHWDSIWQSYEHEDWKY